MAKSLTEVIGQPAVDQIHEAIRVAWQAGYDQAMIDLQNHEQHLNDIVAEDIGE